MSIAHLIEKIHIFPNFLQLQKQDPFPSEFFGAIAFYGNTVILGLSVGRAYIDRRNRHELFYWSILDCALPVTQLQSQFEIHLSMYHKLLCLPKKKSVEVYKIRAFAREKN